MYAISFQLRKFHIIFSFHFVLLYICFPLFLDCSSPCCIQFNFFCFCKCILLTFLFPSFSLLVPQTFPIVWVRASVRMGQQIRFKFLLFFLVYYAMLLAKFIKVFFFFFFLYIFLHQTDLKMCVFVWTKRNTRSSSFS